MSTFKEMASIKDKVRVLLAQKPKTRDSDEYLIAMFWWQEDFDFFNDASKTAKDFLGSFSSGKFTKPESIRRVRQKIMEQHPELRGKSYIERRKQAVEVKQNIKTL